MSTPTLEERVATLEAQVARLNQQLEQKNAGSSANAEDPWCKHVYGAFAGDPAFLEAMELGRQWRESFRPKPARKRKVKNGRARHRSRKSARGLDHVTIRPSAPPSASLFGPHADRARLVRRLP